MRFSDNSDLDRSIALDFSSRRAVHQRSLGSLFDALPGCPFFGNDSSCSLVFFGSVAIVERKALLSPSTCPLVLNADIRTPPLSGSFVPIVATRTLISIPRLVPITSW